MRNLIPTICHVLPSTPLLSGAQSVALDTDIGRLWVINNDFILYSVTLNNDGFTIDVVVDLASNGHVTTEDNAVGMEYLSEMSIVSMATRKGEVLTCNSMTHEVEGVGSVSDGVLCMSWSPDQDLVVMVTGTGNLLLMTREFDPLTEVPINSEDFGEAKPVTVGWGKKETQFHGSLGKPSLKQVMAKPIEAAGPWDDHQPRVSWRGDGEYFACSTVHPLTGARMFRVWTRECTLHSTGEPTNGLGHPLSWRPTGNLIACTQHKPHRYDVIFFERNGLQHGEFTLRGNQSDWLVRELYWNADSTVLAIWMEKRCLDESSQNKVQVTCVQLWTSNNYHWYLKQELHPSTNSTLSFIIWDPIVPLRLHLLTSSGQYLIYNWKWGVSTNTSLEITNDGGVATIDGMKLLYTPFRYVNVPPPMCANEISFPVPISVISFAPPPNSNDIIVILTNGKVGIIKNGGQKNVEQQKGSFRQVTTPPQLGSLTSLQDTPFHLYDLRQLLWWKEFTLLGVTCQSCDNKSGDQYKDFIMEMTISNTEELNIKETARVPCDGHILCLHGNPNTGTAIIELQDGSVFEYHDALLNPYMSPLGDHVTFGGQSCDKISLATFNDEECVIGLCTKRRQLFINNTKVSSECTSFAVHDDFIILTTDSHSCRVITRHIHPSNLRDVSSDEIEHEESLRKIERGSRIVTAIPSDVRVILQMPRGNLETICPRALVLTKVRRFLDGLQFKDAFLLMRKHRLNLNLLCDHNMSVFLENTRLFVEQMTDVNFINLFLTELKDEDITHSMYPPPTWYETESTEKQSETKSSQVRYGTVSNGGSKVNIVCDAVREVLCDLGEKRYMLSVITTHVRKSPPELETVLEKIKWLRDETPEGVTVDEALKYALFLVDVNDMYNVALGMYDFSLVVMVAEKSQKDPKEYLPFLNELRKLPIHYQRYKIDKYLKRFNKALENISKCGPERFEECLSLISEYKLYKPALKLYNERRSHERHVISKLYGEYLTDIGNHKEAAIVYQSCGELELAMTSFEKAGLWHHVFITSTQLGQDETQRKEMAFKIAAKLKTHRQYSVAARILLDYTNDSVGAILVLLEGGEWNESLRMIHLYGHIKMIDEHVKPALLDAHKNQLLFIESQLSTFIRHTNRLGVVRELKNKKTQAILEGTYAVDEKDADLFSDSSSITGQSGVSSTSRGTRTTAKTGKSRRKAERKKHSLREGSEHEDIALLEALRDIVVHANNTQDEISNLLVVLNLFEFVSEAEELQDNFTSFFESVQSHLPLIWPKTTTALNDMDTKPVQPQVTGPGATVNSIVASFTKIQNSLSDANYITVPQPVLRKDGNGN